MHPALSDFIRAVPKQAPLIMWLDRRAVGGDVNARAELAAITLIIEHPTRSVLEKNAAIEVLKNLPEGPVNYSLYQLIGWEEPGAMRVLQ